MAKAWRAAGQSGAAARSCGAARTTCAPATTGRSPCTAPRSGSTPPARWSRGSTRIVSQSILTGSPFEAFMVKDGVDATTVEGRRRHAVRDPGRAGSAPPEGQRAGAVVAQRRPHPHRLRDGDAGRRDRPRDQDDPVDAAPRSGWATSTRGTAPRWTWRWRSRATATRSLPAGRAWGVAVHESFDSVVAYVVEASLQGRRAGGPRGHRRRALQPGGQPALDRNADPGRGADGHRHHLARRRHHAEGRRRPARPTGASTRSRASPHMPAKASTCTSCPAPTHPPASASPACRRSRRRSPTRWPR